MGHTGGAVHSPEFWMADLSGSWLGTYWQNGQPTRFEMTLVQAQNALSGSILDDGPLGEAQLQGEAIGRSVSFSKRYLTSFPQPIGYSGTVSEDEMTMQGTWKIDARHRGRWEARRSGDDLMAQLKRVQAQRVPVGAGGATTL